ncbi:IclR family transcriptional regulator [Defluviimonas sp. SAOS-178_SWC]|uniref:IclR family transcriptional regulator n=1 Tax=Defluviimonas sp. SAOS-178_SWC TaxID=3121287 RepID=UPI003221D643
MNGSSTTQRGSKEDGKPRVQSVARAVDIVLAVAASRDGLRVAEIREALGLPLQATYHLLHTLRETGLLRKNEQDRITLGIRAGNIADGFARQFSGPDYLQQLVRDLARRTGETSYAGRWIDKDVVSFAMEPGTNPIHASTDMSVRGGDLHARASAKLLMSYLDPSELNKVINTIDFRKRTARTIATREGLLEEIDKVRARGYALDEEEYLDELCCVAVPIRIAGEVYALCTSMPAKQYQHNLDTILSKMLSAANASGGLALAE